MPTPKTNEKSINWDLAAKPPTSYDRLKKKIRSIDPACEFPLLSQARVSFSGTCEELKSQLLPFIAVNDKITIDDVVDTTSHNIRRLSFLEALLAGPSSDPFEPFGPLGKF